MSRVRGTQPKCRHCGHQIRFVRLETGKSMPVDPAPDEDGNVAATVRGMTLQGHVLHKGEDPPRGWQRYMPHVATCGKRPGRQRTRPAPLTLFDQLPGTETR